MRSVDLDTPEHEFCSHALANYARTIDEQNRRATKAEAEVERLRAALTSLRPYFGNLVADQKEVGVSHWQVARDAFAVLGGAS